MKDLTLRQLAQLTGLAIQDLAESIKSSGKDVPDLDSPLSQDIRDLLAGKSRKKTIGLGDTKAAAKPLTISKTKNENATTIAPSEEKKKETDEQKNIKKPTSTIPNKANEKPSKKPIEDEAPAKRPVTKTKITKQIISPIVLTDEDADIDLMARSNRRPKSHNKPQKQTASARPAEIKLIQDLSVTELARKLHINSQALQKQLKNLGFQNDPSSMLDIETAALICNELGVKVNIDLSSAEDLLVVTCTPDMIKKRAPVITIMGHVDHGKTSLLDALRKSNIADKEAGGITQHIGAYKITTKQGDITFIDTPGHEAFTEIRSRGAKCTDIVILVVACDDGVMPQTREALQHAQAANVKIIVALTKIDKPANKIEEIKNQLSQYNIVSSEWGGDCQFIGVSAKTKEGLDELLEAISLEAEMLELKARAEGPAKGTVLEAKLDKSLGPIATILVQEGELKVGDFVIIGTSTGKVRRMTNATGQQQNIAFPSEPVEIIGLSSIPQPGDILNVVKNEKTARLVVSERTALLQKNSKESPVALSLEEMFSQIKKQELHQLNIILKADAQGSLGAISEALSKLSSDELTLKIISSNVGAITKTDIELANASKAIVLGFNVRSDSQAKALTERHKVEVYYFSIIYELINRVKDAIKGIVGPKWEQEIIGSAIVREVFRSSKFGAIAGCMVQDGVIKRNAHARVIRDLIVIFEGHINSLKRFTQDADEVRKNTECGIGIKDYTNINVNDVIEAYILVERDDNS